MNANWNYRLPLALLAALTAAATSTTAWEQPVAQQAKAEITILVPGGAEIFFDGSPTIQRGAERMYVTPPLVVGKQYHYDVLARWQEGGKAVEQTRRVEVSGGARVRLDFLTPLPGGKETISAREIAEEAYIYGYSLITSDVTRAAFINVKAPDPKTFQAPLNQFVSLPKYPPADYHGVTAPNADTLYSGAFLDVSKEPIILSYPDMKDRYFLFPIYSQWTNVISAPGKRTLGTGAQTIAITGPGWKGILPKEITQQVKSPTGSVFIIARIYAEATAEDYAAVNALQKNFKLVPLSSYGKAYDPPEGTIDPKALSVKEIVRDYISAMDTQTYFSMLAKSMAVNPPALPEDAPILEKMAKIGLVPGKPFDLTKLAPDVQKALADVGKTAYARIEEEQKKGGKTVNGWLVTTGTGAYGNNYFRRAAVSAYGWGANLQEDAVYPSTKADADGKPLVGTNTYVVHFAKGETPPVEGFWSITMYDSEYYFYPNTLNKLTVSPRDRPTFNDDGSLDLYFSHEKPEKVPQANWLPAPKDKFILMMRLYWPKEKDLSIINGTWKPPTVKKAS
jgi:uncharacterized protein (TIGR03000 family)